MQTAQYKKLYENALSFGITQQSLQKALNGILRLAILDHTHFSFLLHNINWFNEPYAKHISILQKSLRLYRGKTKQSQKVAYNILTDGMWSSKFWKKACQCLINLIKSGYDSKLLRQSIIQNYPHKVTETQVQQNYLNSMIYLYRNFDPLGYQILEIVILQLASFDTELCTEDSFCFKTFPPDSEIKEARKKVANDQDHTKFDILITTFLQEISKTQKDEKVFTKLLLIFKNSLIHIDQTKYVQFIIYYFAQLSKSRSKSFVTFLLCQIMENMKNLGNNLKILTSLNNYLSSYVCRSLSLTHNSISKILQNIINLITETRKSRHITIQKNVGQNLQIQSNLNKVLKDNFDILLLTQTAIQIWIARPQCREVNKQNFQNMLKINQKQVNYKYFISSQLLKNLQFLDKNQTPKYDKTLKICHKFNPPLIKRLSLFVDQFIKLFSETRKSCSIKLQFIKSQVKIETNLEGFPVKKVKSEKKQSEQTQISK